MFFNAKRFLFLLPLLLFILGCTPSQVSLVGGKLPDHPVKTIAISPNSGILGEAIIIELSRYDFNVIDSQTFSNTMIRLNMTEIELFNPQNLQKLTDLGIDAYLVARTVAGYDDLPESAIVRLNSTHNGQLIAGISWQNGHGGQRGSMADRDSRKNITGASREIVDVLVKKLAPVNK